MNFKIFRWSLKPPSGIFLIILWYCLHKRPYKGIRCLLYQSVSFFTPAHFAGRAHMTRYVNHVTRPHISQLVTNQSYRSSPGMGEKLTDVRSKYAFKKKITNFFPQRVIHACVTIALQDCCISVSQLLKGVIR